MNKKCFSFICLLIVIISLLSCDSENQNSYDNTAITGKWNLVGYGSEESFKTCDYGYLTFYYDGMLEGRGFRNEFQGMYSCSGDRIKLSYGSTKIGYTDAEFYFFEDNLKNSERFCFPVKGRLRLFYSGNEFFEFVRN